MLQEKALMTPNFGLSGEEKMSIHVDIELKDSDLIKKCDTFSLYLCNDSGTKIHLNNLDVCFDENWVHIDGTIDTPHYSLFVKESRIFDLLLQYENNILNIYKLKFTIYDSVVVLVHGILSSSAIWSKLVEKGKDNILFFLFNYEKWNSWPAISIVDKFDNFIRENINSIGYTGKFDIICHSMGAQITRLWMLNYPTNNNKNVKRIRQWIGIAPVNHGCPSADKFLASVSAKVLNYPGFLELKTTSATTKLLEENEVYESSSYTNYRVIVGYNGEQKKLFYVWYERRLIPEFLQKTKYWDLSEGFPIPLSYGGKSISYNSNQNTYYKTYYGDGSVANLFSILPYASLDAFDGLNHSTIVKDDDVIDLLVRYLISNPDVNTESKFKELVECEMST